MKKNVLSSLAAGMVIALGSLSGTASAGLPVIDAAHIGVSTVNAGVNAATLGVNTGILVKMGKLLGNQENFRAEGNYYWNTFELSNIVNNYYDGDAKDDDVIIPIPIDIGYEDLEQQQGDFSDAEGHDDDDGFQWDMLDVRHSSNTHRTNGALLHTVQTHQQALAYDIERTRSLTDGALSALRANAGRNVQLQYQNLLMADQTKHLTQMRGLMLAGENQRVARAQADADREAREMVSSKRLRAGAEPSLLQTSTNTW